MNPLLTFTPPPRHMELIITDELLRNAQKTMSQHYHAHIDTVFREAISRVCGGELPCREFMQYMGTIIISPDRTLVLTWGRRENVIAVIPPIKYHGPTH